MQRHLINPNVAFACETNVLKKFVKAAGFGIEARKRELTSGDLLNKLIARYEATCGAAATNVFHPTCLSCRPVFMQLLCYDMC
jgi:hypothetical protein